MHNQESQITGQKQPNSRHCFVCGLENPVGLKLRIYRTEPGVIETTYTAPDHFQGYPGVLHGGIVASLLDEISGRAHMGDPSTPRFMFTGKMEIKYRANRQTAKNHWQSRQEQGQNSRRLGGYLR